MFMAFDENGDGKLSKEELIKGYTSLVGEQRAHEEVNRIMEAVDADESGFIDYSEFVSASLSRNQLLNKANLQRAFSAFDKDGSGSIDVSELK
jgi:calcium-dependent protein kinase